MKVDINKILLKRKKTANDTDNTFPKGIGDYEYVDYANVDIHYEYKTTTDPMNALGTTHIATKDAANQSVIGQFEVADPRQNLKSTDWIANAGNTATNTAPRTENNDNIQTSALNMMSMPRSTTKMVKGKVTTTVVKGTNKI